MNNWCYWAISASLLATFLASCDRAQNASAGTTDLRDKQELPYYRDAAFTPHWLAPDAAELDTFHRVRPFVLVNQKGDSIRQADLDGKLYVADFFFTSCPGICPKMTRNMAVLQERFAAEPDVLLLSHSVMPKYDSVPVLREYADAKGINDKKWWLLTGDRDVIYRLGRKDYFIEEDLGEEKDPDEFLHTENFVLIDRDRRIRGIYNGLNTASVEQLVKDVHTLLKAK